MKKILGIWICCAVAVSAMAAPARRIGQVRTLADGTEKTVYQHGDEFFHYLTDEDADQAASGFVQRCLETI